MSSFGAAQAASAHVPVPVIAREMLHSGAIVEMRIPVGATEGTYPNGNEEIPFLQFCHNIRGGRVNFFVHTSDDALRGKTITASATVLKKTLEDGRQYLYVDLVPVAEDTPATHRLAVMNKNDGSWSGDGYLTFETPAPLSGLIIFTPPEVKIVVRGSIVPMPKKTTSGDSQLDRLLADGWQIESENAQTVKLFKMKGDKTKTMVHHRPKNSCRK